jgi:hypothetical protein
MKSGAGEARGLLRNSRILKVQFAAIEKDLLRLGVLHQFLGGFLHVRRKQRHGRNSNSKREHDAIGRKAAIAWLET